VPVDPEPVMDGSRVSGFGLAEGETTGVAEAAADASSVDSAKGFRGWLMFLSCCMA